jgi:ABC-type transport system involved in multi-copper enzyme maturation permease subunit
MLGPILAQELLLSSRRGRQLLFRRIYTGWLILQLAFFYWLYLIQLNVLGVKLFSGQLNNAATGEFVEPFTNRLIWQQFILIFLATPAFTAGAISDEKARGTLQYLLTADVTPWEIVVGKLLGRLAQMAVLLLPALPLLCFFGAFATLNLATLLAGAVVTAAPLFGIAAMSLLASVWSRQTRDAVLGVYLIVIAGALLLWVTGGLFLFDPLHVLEPIEGDAADWMEFARRFLIMTLSWGALGVGCLALATWRLRPAYLRQLAGDSRPRKVRWWRAQRAPVADEPLRWKERHVEGIAPLATLRRFPRWLGIILIIAVTLLISLGGLAGPVLRNMRPDEAGKMLSAGQLDELGKVLPPAGTLFQWQGVIAILAFTLMVGLRCSGAITGERERQTWEALLLTPLPAEQLVRGKLWGIIGAGVPYLLAYAIPATAVSVLFWIAPRGWLGTFWTVLLLGVTVLAMAFVGAAGLWCSARSKSSWRSLVGTVAIGYGGGFFLLFIAMPLALMVFLVIALTLALMDTAYGNQTNLARWFMGTGDFFMVCTYIALVIGFLLLVWYFLADAQKYIADRERTRHWKHEPETRVPVRRRRVPVGGEQGVST